MPRDIQIKSNKDIFKKKKTSQFVEVTQVRVDCSLKVCMINIIE